MYPYAYCSIIYNKIWKQLRRTNIDEWMKMWYICTMKYYSATKKRTVL